MNFGVGVASLLVVLVHLSHGKLKSHGNWNRKYPDYNITIASFFDLIAERVHGELGVQGNGLQLSEVNFDVNNTLFGVKLEGKVRYLHGLVTEFGNVSRSSVAVSVNRSDDLTTATVNSGIRVSNISLLYDLRGDLSTGNVDGTVDVALRPNIDFFFELVHTFATEYNTVTFLGIGFTEQFHNFQPRTPVVYAMEKLTANGTGVDVWYGQDLERWQSDVLAPLIVKSARGIPFPVSPY